VNPGEFRRQLVRFPHLEDVRIVVSEYFAEFKDLQQQDTRNEPFLMGGHG